VGIKAINFIEPARPITGGFRILPHRFLRSLQIPPTGNYGITWLTRITTKAAGSLLAIILNTWFI
jgi:hypothetical protein